MKIIPYNEVGKLHLDPLCSINLDFMCNLLMVKNSYALGFRGFVLVLFFVGFFFWCLAKLLVVRKAGVQGSLEACLLHMTV